MVQTNKSNSNYTHKFERNGFTKHWGPRHFSDFFFPSSHHGIEVDGFE